MSTVWVTGAAGFIGSHLVEQLLQQGQRVVGIDNFDAFYDRSIKESNLQAALSHPGFSFYELDLRVPGCLHVIKEKPDTVFHLAAKAGVLPSLKDPAAYTENNINATQHLLDFIKDAGIKNLVFASSSSIYGNAGKTPFSETDTNLLPISPYAFTKKSGELLTYVYHHLYKMNVVNLRFFTVYGERQRPDLAIHKFTKQILSGKPVTMYGDGSTARDYTYVGDIVKGILQAWKFLLAQESSYEIINLGNHSPVTLHDLIHTLYEVLGETPRIVQEPMKDGDVNVTWADITKAGEKLGYTPETTFREGLQKFVAWYKKEKGNA